MFTETSPWQAWVDFCRERGPVDPDEMACNVSVWSRAIGDVTVGEAVAMMDDSGEKIGTAIWIAQHALDVWPVTLRAALLQVIALDPPRASIVYMQKAVELSEPEKRILWDAFADAMPVMRERLSREIGEPQDA